jgi:channel protein (hemolysin III family)
MDYAGIAIMIAGSTTSPFYYSFMCKEMEFYRYLYIGVTWGLCLLAVFVTIAPKKTNSWLNATVFILAGHSCVPGLIHLTYYADERYVPKFDVSPWLIGGLLYTGGAIIYAAGFPERCFKRTFDLFG